MERSKQSVYNEDLTQAEYSTAEHQSALKGGQLQVLCVSTCNFQMPAFKENV